MLQEFRRKLLQNPIRNKGKNLRRLPGGEFCIMKKKILITCFEPFGGKNENTSEKAVGLLEVPAGITVKKLLVPVVWWKSIELLKKTIDEFEPDAVILCGLASSSNCIRVEKYGHNICGIIKDNEDRLPDPESGKECEIVPGGEERITSTFDYERISAAINAAGVPAAVSESAGTYICNHILYAVLDYCRNTGIPAGFIHVPDAEEFGGKIPLKDISTAIETAIENI